MMQITFGVDLDGASPEPGEQWLMRGRMGPFGLLSHLEQSVGLPPSEGERLARVLAYREALSSVPGTPFFAESMARDAVSTAAQLLRRRDVMQLGLVADGQLADLNPEQAGTPARIADILRAEQRFRQSAATTGLGEGDRILRITSELRRGSNPMISGLICTDDEAALAPRWVDLLKQLGARFATPENKIRDRETPLNVRIISGFHPGLLSRHFAKSTDDLEASQQDSERVCAIIPKGQDTLLSESVRDANLGGLGCGFDSACSPLFQLPLLLTRLIWSPFHPQHLIEYLHARPNPLPREVCRNLASALNSRPGRENELWNKAISDARAAVVGQAEPTDQHDAGVRFDTQITKWLPVPEFPETARVEVLRGHVLAIAEWAGARGTLRTEPEKGGRADDILGIGMLRLAASSHQLARTLDALVMTGADSLNRAEWDKLLALWLSDCGRQTTTVPELSSIERLTRPSHLITRADHVLWWRPPGMPSARIPWSGSEVKWLEDQGVGFACPNAILSNRARIDRRPLALATRTLTIFHATQEAGESIAEPPVISELRKTTQSDIRVTNFDAQNLLVSEPPTTLTVRRLPTRQRFWQLPVDRCDPATLLAARPKSSYSSLSTEIWSPADWVLRYTARLKRGHVADQRCVDSVLRQGSLLHEFVDDLVEEGQIDAAENKPLPENSHASGLLGILLEKFFHSDLDPEGRPLSWYDATRKDATDSWVAGVWNDVLAEHAAHYLASGNESISNELLHLAQGAIHDLLHHFKAAGVVRAWPERSLVTEFENGLEIQGRIDLILQREDGAVAVLDLKLGGSAKHRTALDKGLHLQLSAYGKLLTTGTSNDDTPPGTLPTTSPSCAYFTFRGGQLLTRSRSFFPEPDHSSNRAPEWQDCWDQFVGVWRWRRAQLESGLIEIPIEGTDPDDTFSTPPGASDWASPKNAAEYSDHLHLFGWKDGDR